MRLMKYILASSLVCAIMTLDAGQVSARERLELTGHSLVTSASTVEGNLNINTATEAQWVLLPGIGPVTAGKLVAYRNKHPFAEVSHVMRVKGIGRKTFNRIKPHLALKGSTTLQKVKGKGKTKGKAKAKAKAKG